MFWFPCVCRQLQNQLQRGAMALKQTGQLPPLPCGANSTTANAGADANTVEEVTAQLQPVEVQRGRTVPVTRVLRLSGAVDAFLQTHKVQHSIRTAETAWPYSSQKPPSNPATRHAACGVPAGEVVKCWFLAIERSDTKGRSADGAGGLHLNTTRNSGGAAAASDAKSNPSDDSRARSTSASPAELVWLVAAGSAAVNLAAVAEALGIEDATRVRLANRQQLCASSLCGPNGHETDLVYSSKKFKLCPPLVGLPAAVDVVVMSELFAEHVGSDGSRSEGQQQHPAHRVGRHHYVEVGFGRYAILGGDELRRALHIAAAGLPAEGGDADRSAQGGCNASPRGRVLEVPGLQAATNQRGQILC